MNGADQPAVTEDLHGAADGAVGHAVVPGKVPLCSEPRSGRQFAGCDPRGDVIRDAQVGEVGVPPALRFKITTGHSSNIAAADLRK
jgi:hypothetical protein